MPTVEKALSRLFENTLDILPYPAFIYHAGSDSICAMNNDCRRMDGSGFDLSHLLRCRNEYTFIWRTNQYTVQKKKLDNQYHLYECRVSDPEITKLNTCISRLDGVLRLAS